MERMNLPAAFVNPSLEGSRPDNFECHSALGKTTESRQKLFEHTRADDEDFRVLKYSPFGRVKRFDVVAEFFNLFNRANVSQINAVFGSGLTPIPGFRQPVAGTVHTKFSFPWISSFEKSPAG